MLTLPVSGASVAPRSPNGTDDMLLAEAPGSPVEVGLALVEQLYGAALDGPELVVTDFEYLLLQLRAFCFGQAMALGFVCPHCQEPAEISFQLADFLTDVRPRAVAGVTPHPSRRGWLSLEGAGFRLPTAGDQAAVAGVAPLLAETRLAKLCLDETARTRPHRSRVERAMEAMAPSLSREVAGRCPGCGSAIRTTLAVASLVVAELKRTAAAVHDEVDLIARAYHWPEPLILSLPQPRRRAYAERIRRVRLLAA